MTRYRFTDKGRIPVRTAFRAVEARVRPDFRKAVIFGLLALVLVAATHGVGGVHSTHTQGRLVSYGTALAFVIFGVAATRSAAVELSRVSESRAGAAAATPLRVACLLAGYAIVLLVAIDLFELPLGHLLVGGAVTGIVLGIAAQQALGNVFAGIVLLFARPYIPGERIRIRSGSLGGQLDGTVSSVGLLYTTLATPEGPVNIPNGGLLAAAVGPLPPEESPAPDRPADERTADERPADERPADERPADERPPDGDEQPELVGVR